MATPIDALQANRDKIQGALNSSSTAYAPETPPTKRDVSNSSQLAAVNKQIDTIKSTALRNQWYGASTSTNTNDVPAEGAGSSDGWLMSGFKALQRPLNAIAGTAQYALGKGTESSLAGNINQAMKTGLTSGDVLRQEGAPRAVQIPLGFALDVMFDPVNWLTAGTSALIPRVGTGLIKGGLKEGGIMGAIDAAKTGLTSGLERKAASVMDAVPFAKKIPAYAAATEKVGNAAVAGAEKFDNAIGTNVYDRLGKGIFGQSSGLIGNAVENTVRKLPSVDVMGKSTPSGNQIVDYFKYSTRTPMEIADLKDTVSNLYKQQGMIAVSNAGKAEFQSVDDIVKAGKLPVVFNQMADDTVKSADSIFHTGPTTAAPVKIADTFENAQKLLETAGQDYNLKHLTAAYKGFEKGKTGVQWYDNVIDSLKNTTVNDLLNKVHLGTEGAPTVEGVANAAPEVAGNFVDSVKQGAADLVKNWNSYDTYRDLKPFSKLLDAQKTLLSIFKSAKVPMNVSSHIVAHIGNFFMGAMMGLPMESPEMVNSIFQGSKLIRGKLNPMEMKNMFFNDINSWVDFIDKHPNRFRQMTGIDPSEVIGKINVEQKVMGDLTNRAPDVMKFMKDAWTRIEVGMAEGEHASDLTEKAATFGMSELPSSGVTAAEKAAIKKGMGAFKTPSETLASLAKEGQLHGSDMTSSYLSNEIYGATPQTATTQKWNQFTRYVADQAALHPLNPAVRAANTLLNSMPKWYEHIDQSFKIGSTDFMTRVGLTEQQLITISRTVPITAGDIANTTVKAGQKMYHLNPLKAAEVATETYMNYAGMPEFVQTMRALPIVGSPFLSFAYAMTAKTGKTAVNNPAIFNKVGFLLNEISGARSPEEKVAMEQKYNQYLKSPTVVKVFGMWNTDVKNWVPWYQMNMLNPSEKTYDNSTQSQILKLADNVPILQDPVGSVIKNYFIQPWILSGSGQAAQGQFGEPLFPSFDANGKPIQPSLGTKAFYGARAIGESVVPGALGYLGWPAGLAGMTPEQTNLVPSYGFRNLANATQGRSSVGATTKEDAVRKTLRSLLGRTGIPAYTLDTSKTNTTNP